jgi:hypothetical protein
MRHRLCVRTVTSTPFSTSVEGASSTGLLATAEATGLACVDAPPTRHSSGGLYLPIGHGVHCSDNQSADPMRGVTCTGVTLASAGLEPPHPIERAGWRRSLLADLSDSAIDAPSEALGAFGRQVDADTVIPHVHSPSSSLLNHPRGVPRGVVIGIDSAELRQSTGS